MTLMNHKTNHFKVNKSVAFSAFIILWNYHLCLIPKTFHHLKKKHRAHKQLLLIFPLPQPLANINLLSVCVYFPIFDISYKWNHKVCELLCLLFYILERRFSVLARLLFPQLHTLMTWLWFCDYWNKTHLPEFSQGQCTSSPDA